MGGDGKDPVVRAGDVDSSASTEDVTATGATGAHSPRSRGRAGLQRGATLGHFVILEPIGAGGMATVYAAYDPKLDRKVAVKVVRQDGLVEVGTVRRQRMLREAQAMARLQHPNVVMVHEAGELPDGMFIAMELVDGADVKDWSGEERRGWRTVLDVFRQAGAGLAAAHRAGLVHRDFKPENVLIRSDGRVQVTDFGIVSIAGHDDLGSSGEATASAASDDTSDGGSGRSSRLTADDTRLGTPPYMAPEQHAGGVVDPRTDQFAFCVSLWECLYGQRPFVAATRRELIAAITAGTPVTPPAAAGVPSWVHRILLRGLAVRPDDRFASMDDLLAALARDPAIARRRAVVIGAVVAALAGGVALAVLGLTAARGPSCRRAPELLAGIWDRAVADDVRAKFATTKLPYAAFTARRVEELLDARAGAWLDMRVAACEQTARGDQSGAMLDLRMRCLDQRRDELAALTRVLAGAPDPELVSHAVAAAAQLPAIDRCADRDALSAAVPPPGDAATAHRVAEIRARLAEVDILLDAGRYPGAHALASETAISAATLAYPPVAAEALYHRGKAELYDGDATAAEASLLDAATTAARAKDDATVARALAALVWAVNAASRYGDALALARAATVAATRAGDDDARTSIQVEVAAAQQGTGDLAGARASLEAALAARERLHGAASTEVAQTLNDLANVLDRMGETTEARARYERALAIARAQLGPDHPSTAITTANLCHLVLRGGDAAAARTCQEGALATLVAALGADHPMVAWATNDLALILDELGDRAGAETAYRRALAIWEATSGSDHPDVAWPLINLGVLAVRAGKPAEAIAMCERAARVLEASSGADHPDLGYPLICLGQARLAAGDSNAAIATLRRGIALFETAVADPTELADARFALARALVAAGKDREDALALARAARDVLAAAGPAADRRRSEVEAWLEHPR